MDSNRQSIIVSGQGLSDQALRKFPSQAKKAKFRVAQATKKKGSSLGSTSSPVLRSDREVSASITEIRSSGIGTLFFQPHGKPLYKKGSCWLPEFEHVIAPGSFPAILTGLSCFYRSCLDRRPCSATVRKVRQKKRAFLESTNATGRAPRPLGRIPTRRPAAVPRFVPGEPQERCLERRETKFPRRPPSSQSRAV